MKLNPLVIDLDGTLLNSDLLIESGLAHIRTKPLQAFQPLFWLIRGKAHLKERLAQSAKIDVSALPYNSQVLSLIAEERAKGRSIILATASHKIYAAQIAEHLGLFDRVLATEGRTNLSAQNKRNLLVAEFGESGFDYMGNSHDDFPVWEAAQHAFVVNPENGVATRARKLGNVKAIITTPQVNRLHLWAKELRFHQWLKNLLIFVPLLASHQLDHIDLAVNGLLAFLFFGMCASSVYMLNDLLDLDDDRHHSSKRHRPFASGNLSVKSGLLVFPILLAAAFAGSIWLLPWQFSAALGCYYLLTLAYSVSLKRLMMVDVIALGMLYTLRIIAGTFAFEVSLTFWMLAFSMFIFLSLALVKRYAELREAKLRGKTEKTRGRGYYPDDLEMIASLGGASGYLSVMVLALYIQEPGTVTLYHYPQLIWLSCPLLLFWISRTWMLTHRGHMHDDPVVFAIKDRVSLIVGLLFAATFWFAA